ncbi:MAG TPA: DUF1552 domain-containing protein [Polyangia bacterium]|jgi:hypothetical protein|nr:DUF1552 domain-containing protein [Polyangia bacterium]
MNKHKIELERRHFLKLVGASALTYPFLRGVPSHAAASGAAPTYLVLIFTPCGCVRPVWGGTDMSGASIPRPAYGAAPTLTSNFTFRNTLSPFAKGGTVGGVSWTTNLQSKVLVLDGLNNKAAQGSHEAGMASLWTGQISTGNSATSISIDQQISAQLKAGTPFSSIQLMVRDPADFTDREVKTRMIYNAAGVFVDPIDNPTAAAATCFPNMSSTSTGPDKTTFIRQQLFGSGTQPGELNSELNTLMPKLCNEDRSQLQALQDGWNNLYTQLQAAATASQKCTPPGAIVSSTDFPTNAKQQMDILALALACDLTRVASLQFSTATSQVTHKWLGSNQTDCHHNYSHDGPTYLGALAPCGGYNNMGQCSSVGDMYSANNLNLYQNAAQQEAIDNFYATQVAYLAQKLNGLSGANSGTLLDQSVICWSSELDMGAAHNHDDTPFLLVGGANGQLKTGNLVTFPLDLTDGGESVAETNDRAHNDLLLTLAQVMGTPMSKFGEPTYCTGPITQIINS